MKMRSILLGALLAMLCSSTARADDAADKAKARALFKQAETAYRLGKFKDALAGYEAALKAAHSPTIIFNIAQCHRQLGDARKALFSYKLFLSDWNRKKPGTNPPNKKEVDSHIAALKAQVVEIEKMEAEAARKKALEEEKKKAEEEARKKADQEAKARAEKEKLAAINAQLAARPAVKEAAEKADEGDGKEKASEEKKPKRIAVGYAQLNGVEIKGAQVVVHGQVMGATPLGKPLRLSVGRNRIEVVHESYKHWSTTVEIEEGKTVEVQVELKPKNSPHRILLGTSILCFILAGGSQGLAQVFSKEYEDEQESYDTKMTQYKDDYAAWQAGTITDEPDKPKEVGTTNRDLMYTGHALTGVFGAAAVGTLIGFIVTYVKYTRSDPAPEAQDDPAVTLLPGLNGVTLMGRF